MVRAPASVQAQSWRGVGLSGWGRGVRLWSLEERSAWVVLGWERPGVQLFSVLYLLSSPSPKPVSCWWVVAQSRVASHRSLNLAALGKELDSPARNPTPTPLHFRLHPCVLGGPWSYDLCVQCGYREHCLCGIRDTRAWTGY